MAVTTPVTLDRQRIQDLGMFPSAHGPEAFNGLLRSEVAKWEKVIRESNIKFD